MHLQFLQRQVLKTCQKLLPNIGFISQTSQVINFLTMNMSSEQQQWQHNPNHLHGQHMFAQAYLQLHFKNHIMDIQGLYNIEKMLTAFQEDNQSIIKCYLGSRKGVLADHRKCLYIMDHAASFNTTKLMKSGLMQSKNITKILCFDKSKPINISPQFQKFCLNYSIRALGLQHFTLESLMKQVMKQSKMSMLIHETVMGQTGIYTAKDQQNKREVNLQELKLKPSDIFIMGNLVSKVSKPFLKISQLIKQYPGRNYRSKPQTENFMIKRFQRIDQFINQRELMYFLKLSSEKEEGVSKDDDQD